MIVIPYLIVIFTLGCVCTEIVQNKIGTSSAGITMLLFVSLFLFPFIIGGKYVEKQEIYTAQVSKENIPFVIADDRFINLAYKLERNVKEGDKVVLIKKSYQYTYFFVGLLDKEEWKLENDL